MIKYKTFIEDLNCEKPYFYFSTPQYELLADGLMYEMNFSDFTALRKKVNHYLHSDGLRGKVLVGAIPFDSNLPGSVFLTSNWKIDCLGYNNRKIDEWQQNIIQPIQLREVPECEEYTEAVRMAVKDINEKVYKKIVLARGLEIIYQEDIEVSHILKRIYSSNQSGYTYATNIYGDYTLAGASPEMLISKRDRYISSNPLAGSRPRGKNCEEDERYAEELCKSEKDLCEHSIVVEYISSKFKEICKELHFSQKPSLLKTKQMWHLSTIISGTLLADTNVIDLATLIHPTPAICGVPVDKTRNRIKELEGFNRNLYTGIIGWCDENGDGDWAIILRGSEIYRNRVNIFAGAGIVKDSNPAEELAETNAKLSTMLFNLGIIKK